MLGAGCTLVGMANNASTATDQRRREFSRVLSEAIKSADLTLEQIVDRLRVAGAKTSPATLSYWQNGHSLPTRGRSVEVVQVLEGILHLPAGTLSQYLTNAPNVEYKAREVLDDYDALNDILLSMDLDLGHHATMLASHDISTVHTDGTSITEVAREVMRVESETLRAIPLVYEDPVARRAPALRAIHGGTVGRTHVDDTAGLFVGEFVLERPLKRGDVFWVEFAIDWPSSGDGSGAVKRMTVELGKVSVFDVYFEGAVPPVIEYVVREAGAKDYTYAPARVVGNHATHVVEDVAPGIHGISWKF